MLILFAEDQYINYPGCSSFSEFLEFRSIRLNQIATVCYVLTDSVFFVLCAYFDGSMVFFDDFLP